MNNRETNAYYESAVEILKSTKNLSDMFHRVKKSNLNCLKKMDNPKLQFNYAKKITQERIEEGREGMILK